MYIYRERYIYIYTWILWVLCMRSFVEIACYSFERHVQKWDYNCFSHKPNSVFSATNALNVASNKDMVLHFTQVWTYHTSFHISEFVCHDVESTFYCYIDIFWWHFLKLPCSFESSLHLSLFVDTSTYWHFTCHDMALTGDPFSRHIHGLWLLGYSAHCSLRKVLGMILNFFCNTQSFRSWNCFMQWCAYIHGCKEDSGANAIESYLENIGK